MNYVPIPQKHFIFARIDLIFVYYQASYLDKENKHIYKKLNSHPIKVLSLAYATYTSQIASAHSHLNNKCNSTCCLKTTVSIWIITISTPPLAVFYTIQTARVVQQPSLQTKDHFTTTNWFCLPQLCVYTYMYIRGVGNGSDLIVQLEKWLTILAWTKFIVFQYQGIRRSEYTRIQFCPF